MASKRMENLASELKQMFFLYKTVSLGSTEPSVGPAVHAEPKLWHPIENH